VKELPIPVRLYERVVDFMNIAILISPLVPAATDSDFRSAVRAILSGLLSGLDVEVDRDYYDDNIVFLRLPDRVPVRLVPMQETTP
jgi:hypothetical protein